MKLFLIIVIVGAVAYFGYRKYQESQEVDTSFTGRAFMDPEEYEQMEAERLAAEEQAGKEADAPKPEKQTRRPGIKKAAVAAESEAPAGNVPHRKKFQVKDTVQLLVVEDNQKDAEALRGLLTQAGAKVLIAETGIRCLEMTKETAFDMIFVSRYLHRMDGVQTVHNMRRNEGFLSKDAPVYAVLPKDSEEPAIFFEKEGFAGTLRKPVGNYSLQQALIDGLPAEKVLADDAQKKHISDMAGQERTLQEAGVLLSVGLKNFTGSMTEFKKAADKYCEDYEEASGSLMDSLYGGNAREYMDKARELRNASEKIGALYLADMFDDHVNMAKNDDMEIAEASWRTLELEWEGVVAGLGKWLGKTDLISGATDVLSDEE